MQKNPRIMQGQVCIVTGANSGIGKVTSRRLAAMGATVVLVCRDQTKGQYAIREIRAHLPGASLELLLADLSSQEHIRRLASEIQARFPRINVLINNAGAINAHRTLSEDGMETTFAVNHLSYFLLTELLLPTLQASAPSRIVNVASIAERRGRTEFDNLQGERRYSSARAYQNSKRANLLFTYELARRLEGTGVTANCLHPGLVRTNFGNRHSWWFRFAKTAFMAARGVSAETGAATVVHLASSAQVEGVTGQYFERLQERASSPSSHDPTTARRLWEVSEALTSAGPPPSPS
jgi:retinol dehydrogenase-14